MYKDSLKNIIFLLFISLSYPIGLTAQIKTDAPEIKAVVCDLGYVTVQPSSLQSMVCMGNPLEIIWLFLSTGMNAEKARIKCYDVLLHAGGEQEGDSAFLQDNLGLRLPRLMAEWLMGRIETSQIQLLIDDAIEALLHSHYFKSMSEASLVKYILKNIMFNPKNLASTMTHADGIKLVEKLSKEVDHQGNKKFEFYILSNWDRESFQYLLNSSRLQEKVFKYFASENIMYSGKCGLAKPHPAFFELFLKTYNLKPEECLFIDDQPENIVTAQELGMHIVQWDKNDIPNIERRLKDMGLLSE